MSDIPTRDYVTLYVNGRPLKVRGDGAFLPLSEFLRRRQGLTGTKVVCAEGDCGSCAVMIGRVRDGGLVYNSVASCIQIVAQLDGVHVVTVEGLKRGGQLNVIQESLVQCQGTQCGFCTPGFVVSMYDAMRPGQSDGQTPVDAHVLRRALVGNLCRCTGYDSIVKAGLAVDPQELPSPDELYPPEPIVASLSKAATSSVLLTDDESERRLFKPTSVEEACGFFADNEGSSVLAGGTDLGVLENKRIQRYVTVVSLADLPELRGVDVTDKAILIGAGESLTTLERLCQTYLPSFADVLAYFGSPLIKNAGTVAGNLVTASPISDTAPTYYATNATLELVGPAGRRSVTVEDFHTGYRKTQLQAGEIVASLRIPLPKQAQVFKAYKVSRRVDLDIASFGAAFLLTLDGDTITGARIAYGGVAATTLRMRKTEDALVGQPLSLATMQAAAEVAMGEVTPMTDVRGSEAYRRQLAGNILLKLYHDLKPAGGGGSNGRHVPPAPPTNGQHTTGDTPLRPVLAEEVA